MSDGKDETKNEKDQGKKPVEEWVNNPEVRMPHWEVELRWVGFRLRRDLEAAEEQTPSEWAPTGKEKAEKEKEKKEEKPAETGSEAGPSGQGEFSQPDTVGHSRFASLEEVAMSHISRRWPLAVEMAHEALQAVEEAVQEAAEEEANKATEAEAKGKGKGKDA